MQHVKLHMGIFEAHEFDRGSERCDICDRWEGRGVRLLARGVIHEPAITGDLNFDICRRCLGGDRANMGAVALVLAAGALLLDAHTTPFSSWAIYQLRRPEVELALRAGLAELEAGGAA